MAGAYGWRSKLGIGQANPVTRFVEFNNENLKINQRIDDLDGLRGTLSHVDARARETQRFVDGGFTCQPVPAELDTIIPLIIGGAKVNDATPMVPTWPIPSWYATVDRDLKVFTYSYLKVNTAVFEATVGGPMKLTLNVLGLDETVAAAGTFPAISPVEDMPYILSDLALTVGGVAYPMRTLTLTLDNKLEIEWFNSIIPTRIGQTEQLVTWGIELPWGDTFGLYGTAVSAAVVCQAVFTNGAKSITFLSNTVRSPKVSPVVGGVRGEIPHMWQGTARITAANPNIISITNDST